MGCKCRNRTTRLALYPSTPAGLMKIRLGGFAARAIEVPMNTGIDHLPRRKQDELARVVAILREEFDLATAGGTQAWRRNARIVRIILFGSHATGRWVDEPHTMKGYRSDFDLLVIVNHKRLTDWSEYWYNAEDRLNRLIIEDTIATPVNFIVEAWETVTNELARGHYFFSDIAREGITLYKLRGGKPLPEPQSLNPDDARATAQKHFDQWFESADQFRQLGMTAMSKAWSNVAAFELHQAVERLYSCVLLVTTNYRPNSHNIKFLRSLAEDRLAAQRRLLDTKFLSRAPKVPEMSSGDRIAQMSQFDTRCQ